jgi:hypothetical protein
VVGRSNRSLSSVESLLGNEKVLAILCVLYDEKLLTGSSILAFFLEFAEVIRPALTIPVFVTGGFQTAAAMVKAINNGSTDGIGLGRPACEEPHLPKHLIEGKVNSKVASAIDYDDFGIWGAFAGMQIRRLGFGMPTADSTDEKVVKEFSAELQAFFELMMKKLEKGVIISGFPRFGTPALPWEGF